MSTKPVEQWTDKDVDGFIEGFCKPVPGLIRGKIENPLKQLAHEDRDHNGKSDVLEWLVEASHGIELAKEVNDCVDFELLADYAEHLPFIKDQEAFKAAMHKVAARVERAQKLVEAQKLLSENQH